MPLGIEVFGPVAEADVEPARSALVKQLTPRTLVLLMVALVAVFDQTTAVGTDPVLVIGPLTWAGSPVHKLLLVGLSDMGGQVA